MTTTKKQLNRERKQCIMRMQELAAAHKVNGLTPAEKQEFDRVEDRNKQIRTALNNRKGIETRGAYPKGKKGRTEADERFTRYLRSGDTTDLTRLEIRTDGTGITTAPNDAGTPAGPTGPVGGYLIPQGFWKNLQVALKAYGGLAADFRVVDTETGNPMPWPTIDPTGVTAALLGSELNQLNITNPYVFGQGVMNAWTIAVGPVLVSLQMINDSAFDVDNFVSDRFGEAIGREIAALAVSGTGAAQPLGVMPSLAARGAASGASGGYVNLGTATTVKTFASASPTELTGNVLSPQTVVNMVEAVDPAYWPSARFYMNAAQAVNQRSVTDANGRPLINFANGYADGAIGSMLGFPVVVDNSLPNLTASTVGGPVFGNMQHAMVMRTVRGQSTVMRLTERYADFLAVGYLGYYRFDIRSNDLRAACTVKPAAT